MTLGRCCEQLRKLRPGCGLSAALMILVECATNRPSVVLAPVGPLSGARAALLANEDGYLRVYSATETRNDGGIIYYPHTPYSIYTSEGKHFKGVLNHAGADDQKPMTVPLPPGRYAVYAQAEGFGQVTVPVLIVSARMTVVFLEGKGLPEADALPQSEVVRLPNGLPVGRRAAEPLPSKPR